MRSTIRSATLIGYAELARSVGLDPHRLMRRCGLNPSCLSDPDLRIDAVAVAKLLETSAAESQVEDFGLRLSTARRLSNLGPFSLVVREETTARRALETLGRYLQLHSELLSIRIEDAGDLVILRVDIVRGARMPRRQGIELFVGYLFRILQELLGPSWKPRRVLFTHSAPASLTRHVAMFGRIVDFDADFNGIVCGAGDLAGLLPTADPVMARYARQYLDAMISRPDMTLAALRHSEETDQGPVGPLNQQRALILEKARAAIAPNLNTDMRRDPRTPCVVAARVRIGLARIQHELSKPPSAEGAADTVGGNEQIEVYAVAGPIRTKKDVPDEADTLSASLAAFSDPVWQVKDRSVAGLRIYAASGVGQALTLGALVAVRQSDRSAWVLGVVRRLNKLSTDELEAGVSIIAERVVPVTLHAKREVKEGMGIVVNGFDSSMLGPRIDALYLPPPSRPDKPLVVKTVIVPTQEYAEGRKVILMTGRSIYTVALRQLVEQRADWSWVAIQVVEKLGRA